MAHPQTEAALRVETFFTTMTSAEDLAQRIHRVQVEVLRVLPDVEEYRREELLNNLDHLEAFRDFLLGINGGATE